ncbi:MAG: hypothetical protein H0X24_15545 [Ktedonobacterales bacterium]|nr:hypothetical protein [Ktedonobacterales bacterium]
MMGEFALNGVVMGSTRETGGRRGALVGKMTSVVNPTRLATEIKAREKSPTLPAANVRGVGQVKPMWSW